VHPIERLRYVARASGADQDVLVRESAGALAALGLDPAGLVTACRRIVDRHPTSGPLWWLCARVLTAPDPTREGWRAAEEIAADTTAAELAHALPEEPRVVVIGWPELAGDALLRRGDATVLAVDAHGTATGLVRRLQRADVDAVEVPPAGLAAAVVQSDLVLVEPSAVGPTGFVAPAGSHAAAAVGRAAGIPVWCVVGVGRLLPTRMWDALVTRLDTDEPWEEAEELVPLGLVDAVAGPCGLESVDAALRRIDAPVAPELFRTTAF
jgi:hypothetical protein